MSDLYSKEAQERRDKFNNIINKIDMVLMNNIVEVDPSVWENWTGKSPLAEACEIEDNPEFTDESDSTIDLYICKTHDTMTSDEYECDEYADSEVYQWFAVSDNDADYLARHNQYITYSDMLDTYFLAICHFGTSWDYVDSMVDDILGEA